MTSKQHQATRTKRQRVISIALAVLLMMCMCTFSAFATDKGSTATIQSNQGTLNEYDVLQDLNESTNAELRHDGYSAKEIAAIRNFKQDS
ncbi:MAG: hypothetical protein LBD12_06675 [Clostridiales Family XIII bacterium]|jgi:competence protein ComGC|nr:hypothetical protein [Clostridiales Family XIII bacterium]